MYSEQLLNTIVGTNQLSDSHLDDIATIVRDYPFFSPAQYLLAIKQRNENNYAYEGQLQKAALYFNNQIWLNYLLHEKEVDTPNLGLAEIEPIVELPKKDAEENIFPTSLLGSNNSFGDKEIEDPLHTIGEQKEEIAATQTPEFDYSTLFSTNTSIEIPTLEAVKQMMDSSTTEVLVKKGEDVLPNFPSILKEPIASTIESRIQAFSFGEHAHQEIVHTKEEDSETIEVAPLVKEAVTAIENVGIEQVSHAQIDHVLEENHIHDHTDNVEQHAPIVEIPSYNFKGFEKEALKSENHLDDAVSISEAYAKNHIFHEVELDKEEDTDKYDNNNIASIISNQAEHFNKPLDKDAKLDFENEKHLHTVDYFESQGIKIDLTQQPQDKLTMQMRRFTDWLKQLKKTDPNPQDLGTDPELEKAIENIAKTSIEAKEIVTETMADVFIKQGKISKAIQLYIKLSFLDPSKSTYFATKIQQLKGI